jgi:hypothetical protein
VGRVKFIIVIKRNINEVTLDCILSMSLVVKTYQIDCLKLIRMMFVGRLSDEIVVGRLSDEIVF